MALVTGIHHVSMKCTNEAQYQKVKDFYIGILGLKILKEWSNGCLLDTGNGIVEFFCNGETDLPQGVIRHFAFATEDVDACAEAVQAAGYPVFLGPLSKELPSIPPTPIRIAFCKGPLGEEIEFFKENP